MAYNNILLTSEGTFKTLTNVSENISSNYLLPAIRLAQDVDLEETIGTPLIKSLQDKVKNRKVVGDYAVLMEKIEPFLCYSAIQHLIPEVAWKIANAGVLQTADEKMNPVSSYDIDKVINHYRHIAEVYKNRLQRYLITNYDKFPELSETYDVEEIRHQLHSSAGCGINLGGARGK